MTQISEKYEPTPDDLKRWAKLDELDSTAMTAIPLTDEEYEQRIQSVIDGSCLQKNLDRLLLQKSETLKKLAAIEETEQILRARIAEFQDLKQNQGNNVET